MAKIHESFDQCPSGGFYRAGVGSIGFRGPAADGFRELCLEIGRLEEAVEVLRPPAQKYNAYRVRAEEAERKLCAAREAWSRGDVAGLRATFAESSPYKSWW
jgi:hypothetical protein